MIETQYYMNTIKIVDEKVSKMINDKTNELCKKLEENQEFDTKDFVEGIRSVNSSIQKGFETGFSEYEFNSDMYNEGLKPDRYTRLLNNVLKEGFEELYDSFDDDMYKAIIFERQIALNTILTGEKKYGNEEKTR